MRAYASCWSLFGCVRFLNVHLCAHACASVFASCQCPRWALAHMGYDNWLADGPPTFVTAAAEDIVRLSAGVYAAGWCEDDLTYFIIVLTDQQTGSKNAHVMFYNSKPHVFPALTFLHVWQCTLASQWPRALQETIMLFMHHFKAWVWGEQKSYLGRYFPKSNLQTIILISLRLRCLHCNWFYDKWLRSRRLGFIVIFLRGPLSSGITQSFLFS